jgi:CRP-like cAMP-binding protein
MLCGMQEIARFLAAHKPFDGLAPEALEQTAATVEIAYFPRGASILQQGGEPSRHLYVIVKGTVELRQVDQGDAGPGRDLRAGLAAVTVPAPVGRGRPRRRARLPDPR